MTVDVSLSAAESDPVATALKDPGVCIRMEKAARAFLGKWAGISPIQRAEEAKAVVQEAARRALHKRERFDVTGNVLTWLAGIVINVVREEVKKRRSNKTGSPEEGPTLAQLAVDRSRPVDETISDKLYVRHLLEQLSVIEQQILRMKYHEDLTYFEIGQRIEMNENAVRVRAFRAIQKLKQICGVAGEGQS